MTTTLERYNDTMDDFKTYCKSSLVESIENCTCYRTKRSYICVLPEGTKMQYVYNSIASTFTTLLIPHYIQDILKLVRPMDEAYTYMLRRVNIYRRRDSIYQDSAKLEKWVLSQGADFSIKKVNTKPNQYYIIFEMTDPVAMQLEKEGFIVTK